MKRAQISRIVSADKRAAIGMDRMLVDINLQEVIDNNIDVELYDGDNLKVFSIKDSLNNYVDILGTSVTRPGRYQLELGMKINDLIKLSDGLLDNAYLSEAHLVRLKDDLSNEIFSIDLNKTGVVVQFG